MSWSSVRALGLVIVAPLLCFIVSSVYSIHWSRQIDAATWAIAGNGGPGVVHLSIAREAVRKIEQRAQVAQPSSLGADRAAIAALRADFDRAVAEYRKTPDYPGEFEAWEVMRGHIEPFFAAVGDALAQTGHGGAERAVASARLDAASDALIVSTVALVNLNASAVEKDAATIASLRRYTLWLSNARDGLAFLFVVAGALTTLRGIRQSAALAAERQRRDAERLAELEMFSGRVAHDLRDPLAVIVMTCARASRVETLEDARQTMTRVGDQARRMGVTIDALLAFARAAARPAPGHRSEIRAVVEEVVAEVEPAAAEARVALFVEPIGSASVACDPGVLGVILSNLVRNAVKYTSGERRADRRVTLRCCSHAHWLRVEVEDTGPGIPRGDARHVFEPFVRLPGAIADGKAGIGLGLATVKRFVEANGGGVGVESQPGLGSCFWFTLPLAPPARAPQVDNQHA